MKAIIDKLIGNVGGKAAPLKSEDGRSSPAAGRSTIARKPSQGNPSKPSAPVAGASAAAADHGSVKVKALVPAAQRQPVAAPAVRATYVDASPDVVEKLLSYGGRVLTAPGQVADLKDTRTEFIALLESNWLVVSKSHVSSPQVSSARAQLHRMGYTWTAQYAVDMDVIRQIYQNAQKRFGTGGNDGERMQREFLGIIAKAAEKNASDVHVVVNQYEAVVEFRLDQVLVRQMDLPARMAHDLCQAAFNMADVSDSSYMHMEQQGARITKASLERQRLTLPEGVQSVRLQFSPLPNLGRYMVARLLYENRVGSDADVDTLGYAPHQIDQIKAMRRKPFGFNVISGPTGSGKSTTLQRSMIALMRERPGINVVTIEDPPEYVIPGAKQIPVANASTAEERREKFRQAITGTLRLDPDIIMVGEIRDGVSAHLAFEAAMSGHGLWTSLHTNDAISILDRLRDMGVETYKLGDASLVTGLIGQRLVRVTRERDAISFEEGCRRGFIDRKTEVAIRRLVPDMLDSIRFAGTDNIADLSKFSGRTVVAETILPDQGFLDLWRAEMKPDAVRYWLENLDGLTMLEHAFSKVCMGLVDPREMQDKIGRIEAIEESRVARILELASMD